MFRRKRPNNFSASTLEIDLKKREEILACQNDIKRKARKTDSGMKTRGLKIDEMEKKFIDLEENTSIFLRRVNQLVFLKSLPNPSELILYSLLILELLSAGIFLLYESNKLFLPPNQNINDKIVMGSLITFSAVVLMIVSVCFMSELLSNKPGTEGNEPENFKMKNEFH